MIKVTASTCSFYSGYFIMLIVVRRVIQVSVLHIWTWVLGSLVLFLNFSDFLESGPGGFNKGQVTSDSH